MDGKNKAVLIVLLVIFSCFRAYSQSCSITSKANDIVPDKLCAPVSVTWEVFYRGVDNGGTGDVQMLFDWDDGNTVALNASLTDPATQEWSVTTSHIYPIGGNQCNYHPTVTLVVNGTICTSSVQEQVVTVWDMDDKNGGEISINPRVFPICVGNSGGVTFIDDSQWNCVPPDENDQPNFRKRWIQWIYGTNNGASNFIDNATVGGVVRTYPYAGSIDVTSEPILAPTAPWNEAIPIFVPDNRAVGDEFEITLNNWNYCNPYDEGYDPVTTTAIILIVDDPDGSITPVGPFCENDVSVVLNPATPGGQWSGPGIVNEWTGEFNPALAGPGTHTISYYVEDGNNCSATGTTTITVLDSPVANVSTGPETHLCPGTQLQINGNPSEGSIPYTHLWSGDTSPLNNTNIENPLFETVTEGAYTLTYRITDNNGCFDEQTVIIEVDSVSIQFLNKELTLCSGVTQTLEPNPTGGSGTFIFHEWSGDRTDLLSATDIENPVFNSSTPGLYKYQYIVRDSYGCEDVDSIYVSVYEQPASQAGANDRACGLSYKLDAVPYVGIGQWSLTSGPGSVSFSDISNPNTLVSVDQYGDYVFAWTEDNNGCSDVDEVTITFIEIPTPTVMNDADTCALNYLLVANEDIGVGMWEQVSGSGSAFFTDIDLATTTVTVSSPGIYEFAWMEDNVGCLAGDTVSIDFYPVPAASIAPFDDESCSPTEVTFSNTSTDSDSYLWDFGDGYISNQNDPKHTFTNYTYDKVEYTIELIANNPYGCSDTSYYDIEVLPTPIAGFGFDDTPACSPVAVEFTNESDGATSYTWNFGDGETTNLTNPSHNFVNAEHYVQSFNVELIANNDFGCKDTINNYVTVYPLVNYSFNTTPAEGCHPLKVEMLAEPGAYTYLWDYGDGQTLDGANIANHVFENQESTAKDYTVKLYTSSVFGCKDTSHMTVMVLPSPTSSFSLDGNEGCSPFNASFNNTSAGATYSKWKFGDGHTVSDPDNSNIQHLYRNDELAPQTFKPWLVVENSFGCQDSSSQFISVFPKVTAAISEGGSGCTPHLESLLNNSVGANSFLWDFGDGNTSKSFNGHNEYINSTTSDQTYQVSLMAESAYGCKDETSTSVTVYRRPVPEFNVTPDELQMPESTITLTNNTKGDNWDYKWSFGDDSYSEAKHPGQHMYGVSGDYDIWLKASGANCSDSLLQSIIIYPTLPAIDYGPNSEGCPPLEVQFYNNSVDAYTYFWDFGDGNVSSEKEPKHTYYTTGTYKVKLLAEGPGGIVEADHVEIIVYDKPKADFEVRPTVVKLPETVSFINKSEGAISYQWNFGDGNTSTEHSIQYLYEQAGVYDVTLSVANEKGCTDEIFIREAVIAEEAGSISFPNAFTPDPSGPSGGHYTAGSSENYVFYPFMHEGIVEYELRIYTRWGEIIYESSDIKVGWDGYHNGKLCPGGVYVWKAKCIYSNGNMEVITGDVTLFR